MSKVRVAVVGLHFGKSFVPIYHRHPDVEHVGICDLNPAGVARVGDEFGIARRHASLRAVLESGDYDAVHLVTPVPTHVELTLQVLAAGKHCACAVPMATTLEDLRRIVAAQARSGVNYMMMETGVYSREFLFVRDLLARGELGELTFLRGAHIQDLEGYQSYWLGLPPMHYATHAVAPVLALAGARARKVHCLGSGRLSPRLRQPGGNPFSLQTALLALEGMPIAAEITRSLFQTARPFIESFCIYGDKLGFEWQQLAREDPAVFRMAPAGNGPWQSIRAERVPVPYRPDLLPPELASFAGGSHGGSHPHLVHEFIRSIVEARRPAIDAITAANWTAPGICAHESALRDGEAVTVPAFDV